ncbi:MAG: molybdenum cofactor biosynthesis protein MoaE, partial [Akkermansiaceae bacterium]|nr:molybdenum cofactor biosynthesis protein MoaE [Akkermansiaceae bacterium]
VLRLEYEAHASVAEQEGRRIVAEAVERFGLDRAHAVHRIGRLEIEDLAVVVVVSSPHRAEAFDACRFVIDEIKHRVPIWKKEYYPDGSSEWVGCEGCAAAHRHGE